MSSKERILAAIEFKPVDHIPCWLRFLDNAHLPNITWQNPFERVGKVLSTGLDDVVAIALPVEFHPDVTVKTWKENPSDLPYSLLHKEFNTPKGKLTQTIKQVDSWPTGDEIRLFSDELATHSVKFLVENEENLDKLPYILHKPTDEGIRAFKEEVEHVAKLAAKNNIAVEGEAGLGADICIWLSGVERTLVNTIQNPAFIERFLDIITEWEMARLEIMLDVGAADILTRRGWYENSDFWSPDGFRKHIAKRMKKQAELVHQVGKKYGYIQDLATMPLLDTFSEIDVDILFDVDPVQGKIDMAKMKKKTQGKIALFGGVNEAITMESHRKEDIREAIENAMSILAPGSGFILSVVDCICESTPPENVAYFLEVWKNIALIDT